MEKLVIAASLVLAAICASASSAEQGGHSDSEKAVKLDFETCKREILDDWLSLELPLGIEYISPRKQASECSEWIRDRDAHRRKFADCYKIGFDRIHESIRENGASDAQLKLHERRMKTDKLCNDLQDRIKREFGRISWWWVNLLDSFNNDWKQAPENPWRVKLEDETLSVEICAQDYLKKNEGFQLPADFEIWPGDSQKNFCEDAYERAFPKGIYECKSKYRLSDYLASYSEEDARIYYKLRDDLTTCEPFLNFEWDWTEELPVEESEDEESDDEESDDEESDDEAGDDEASDAEEPGSENSEA